MAATQRLADIRINYSKQVLSEDSVSLDPIEQFKVWLDEALQAEVDEPTAMVLSTASASGRPSARVVLLKDVSAQGFSFYTNYDSRKGQELKENPFASLTFFWPALERQVRIEGSIAKVAPADSDAYFNSRPKGSQIGAWASPQSKEIESRAVIEKADKELTEKYAAAEQIPRPPHWGGYQLQPDRVEFWQGRPNRLHDRILYEQQDGNWQTKRLAP